MGAPSRHPASPDMATTARQFFRILLKGLAFFLPLAAIVVLARLLELENILQNDWADAHLRGHGSAGVALFIGLCAILSSVGLPRQAMSFIGGYAFGAASGLAWATLGVTMGCMISFFYARFLARKSLQKRFGPRIAGFDRFLSQNPLAMTIAVRLFPFGINTVNSMLAGITSIPAWAFFAGSFIGYVPQNLIFALLGSGINVDPLWRTIVALGLFILSSALGYALYRRYRRDASG